MSSKAYVLDQVSDERTRQDRKWGGPPHDDEHSGYEWLGYTMEHAYKAQRGLFRGDGDEYRRRLIEVAALAVAAVQSFDRLRSQEEAARG